MASRFNPLKSLITSPLRAASELRLLLILWAANLLVGLVFSLPFLLPAFETFGHSLAGRDVAFPSMQVWMEFGGTLSRGGGSFLAGSTLLAMVLSFALQLLLSGGIAARLFTGGSFVFFEFAALSVRLWGRNLRLYAWSLIGLVPVLGFGVGTGVLLHALGKPTLFTQKPEEWILGAPLTAWPVAHLAASLFVFAGWRGALDLARVELFADDQRKSRLAAWHSVKRVVRSPLLWLGYALLGALGAAAVLVAVHFHGLLRVEGTGRAWLALLAAQGVVLVRVVSQLSTVAYMADVQRNAPAEAPPVPVVPEAPRHEPAFVAGLGDPLPPSGPVNPAA